MCNVRESTFISHVGDIVLSGVHDTIRLIQMLKHVVLAVVHYNALIHIILHLGYQLRQLIVTVYLLFRL